MTNLWADLDTHTPDEKSPEVSRHIDDGPDCARGRSEHATEVIERMWCRPARLPAGVLGLVNTSLKQDERHEYPQEEETATCPLFKVGTWLHTTPTLAYVLSLAVTGKTPKTIRQLLSEEVVETPSIVGSKILSAGGLAVFAAQPKTGKSLLMQQLALCREYGTPWLGFPMSPGRTLYINTEIAESEFRERFGTMTENRSQLPVSSQLFTESIMGSYKGMEEAFTLIEDFIKGCSPDLVILDPVSQLLEGDDSKQEFVRPFLRAVDRLRHLYEVGIILVHHLRKPPKPDHASKRKSEYQPSLFDVAGSGLWARNPDTIIVGSGKPGGDRLELEFHLRNGGAIESFGVKRGPDLWWTRELVKPVPDQLRPALRALGNGPLAHDAWVKAVEQAEGCSESTAKRRIRQCKEDGWAVPDQVTGGYQSSPEAQQALQVAQGLTGEGSTKSEPSCLGRIGST